MTQPFLPFALPDIGEDEIAEVVAALRSGWVSTGPRTQQFERDFADFLGGGVEAIATNSATAALHLAVEAAGVGPGDEVITTPYTFTATAAIVRHVGAQPVLVDIDPQTFNIDPEAVAAAVTQRTRAIIPVHFAGLACDMSALTDVADAHGLHVVEDAAHALPTRCGGRLIGALDTTATAFSFYATKTITTGEGGMLVTRNADIARRARVMRLHGISRDAFDRYVSDKPSWHYEVISPGFKYNMPDIAAAMGIHQLRRARAFRDRRAAMAARYAEAFVDLPVVLPPGLNAPDDHAWHLFVIRLSDEVALTRDAFIEAMAAQRIGCSVHFIPLHLHPVWRETCGRGPEDLPHATAAYQRAVSLPIYTRMTDDDVERVITAVRAILG